MMVRAVVTGALAGLGILVLMAIFAAYQNPLLQLYLADLGLC